MHASLLKDPGNPERRGSARTYRLSAGVRRNLRVVAPAPRRSPVSFSVPLQEKGRALHPAPVIARAFTRATTPNGTVIGAPSFPANPADVARRSGRSECRAPER